MFFDVFDFLVLCALSQVRTPIVIMFLLQRYYFFEFFILYFLGDFCCRRWPPWLGWAQGRLLTTSAAALTTLLYLLTGMTHRIVPASLLSTLVSPASHGAPSSCLSSCLPSAYDGYQHGSEHMVAAGYQYSHRSSVVLVTAPQPIFFSATVALVREV